MSTSPYSHSFSLMYLCKTFCQILFVFWFLMLSWNMLCLRKSTSTIPTTFKLTYHINTLADNQRNTISFLFPSPKYLTFSRLFQQCCFFTCHENIRTASLRNCQSNNNLFIELSNKPRSICVYFFAVVKFRVFLTRSRM